MLKKIAVLLLTIFLMACTAQKTITEVSTMKLTSPAFTEGGNISQKYTCDGANVNPPLIISNVPAKAKSLVLIMDDPDAVKPAGKVWDHWIVWNILPITGEISEGKEPKGVHGKGTSGNLSYKGPCPPDREHRYFFKLYALDKELNLPEGSTKAEVEYEVQGHILAEAKLVGRYERKK